MSLCIFTLNNGMSLCLIYWFDLEVDFNNINFRFFFLGKGYIRFYDKSFIYICDGNINIFVYVIFNADIRTYILHIFIHIQSVNMYKRKSIFI